MFVSMLKFFDRESVVENESVWLPTTRFSSLHQLCCAAIHGLLKSFKVSRDFLIPFPSHSYKLLSLVSVHDEPQLLLSQEKIHLLAVCLASDSLVVSLLSQQAHNLA